MPATECNFTPPPRSAFAGAVWPAVPGGRAAALLAVLQQLQASQYLPPAEVRARQFRQLGELLAHAGRHVPYYRDLLRAAGIVAGEPITAEAWSRLPILSRRAVQGAGAALHAGELPPGHGKIFPLATSGATGTPVTVLKSELEQFYWHAFTLREEHWHGRDFGGKYLAIRRDDGRAVLDETAHIRHAPDWGPPVALVYPTGPAALLDIRCTVEAQIEALLREAPAYVLSFASNLLALARHCRAHGVALPGLRGVRSSGEVLAPATRELCREVWGVAVVDMYSAVETGYLAFQCPLHEHYHVQSEAALIEVLDDSGGPVAPAKPGAWW